MKILTLILRQMITPDNFTTPTFYNKRVQEINEKFDDLGWIETILPLARIGQDEQGTYPEVYKNDGSRVNIRVMPEGESWLFWRIEGEITETEIEDWYNVPMSVTVWADLTKVYPAKNYDYTAELMKDVIGVLKTNSCNDIRINVDNIFEGFSELEKIEKQNTMLPYTAFKVFFNILSFPCY